MRNVALQKLRLFHRKAFSPKYLLWTNLTISLSLSSTGDVIEQQYEKFTGEIEEYSPKRTGHMALSGVTVGIICHNWYKWLDARIPGRTIDVIIKKVLLDQFICSPLYISVFFITLGLLEQKPREEVFEDMKKKFWRLYAAEWIVWPTAQIINFYWLPTKYRVFYDNIVSLGYDIYTSQVKHKKN